MPARAPVVQLTGAALRPDPRRVLARLFLPGEELPPARSRAHDIVARILALPEDEVESLAARMLEEFSSRHWDFAGTLAAHGAVVASHLPTVEISTARASVIASCFTAEYAVEGAALCNPSAVLHPDQSGLSPGQARMAVSLRGVGEGHVSSIGFAEAVVGPGRNWSFEPRELPVVSGDITQAWWPKVRLRAVLRDLGQLDGLAHAILAELPDRLVNRDVNQVLLGVHQDMLARPLGPAVVELIRRVVASIYETSFPAEVSLSQQVLFPTTPEESNGMEDARFVRFDRGADADPRWEYRATYTAYDGTLISPRLLTSPDLRHFRVDRLTGPAARNKGMALFPRLIGGRYVALCRSDGENTSLTRSTDGFSWNKPEPIQTPTYAWEILQVGNCGSPIETDQGWLVLTHGVGVMRTYRVGAMLLDLDRPNRVIGRLEGSLLQADPAERDGYVPNVVYSCGAVVHDGLLWIPYGIDDARIGVASVPIDELLAAMLSTGL